MSKKINRDPYLQHLSDPCKIAPKATRHYWTDVLTNQFSGNGGGAASSLIVGAALDVVAMTVVEHKLINRAVRYEHEYPEEAVEEGVILLTSGRERTQLTFFHFTHPP